MATQPEELNSEEIREEEELLKESREEEVRSQIVEKYGLDGEVDYELVAKLTQDTLDDRKRFGKLVGQKRKAREALIEAQKKPVVEPEKVQPKEGLLGREEVEKLLTERDFKRDLASLDVSDGLRKEVEAYAKAKGVSPIEAMNSPFIKFMKTDEDKKQREIDASAGGGRRTLTEKDISKLTPKDFDLNSDEGIKAYAEWKKAKGMV